MASDSGIDAEDNLSICQLAIKASIPPMGEFTMKGEKRDVVFFPHHLSHHAAIQVAKFYSVDSVLIDVRHCLERMFVGTQLALTLLSLANSAWTTKSLDTSHVVFVPGTEVVGNETTKGLPRGPYLISHTTRSIHETVVTRWPAKSSLMMLGIMLLELYHGQKIEEQACWSEALIPGASRDKTLFLAAFIWRGTANGKMRKYLGDDIGGDLSEAIRKCICFDFGYEGEFGDFKLVDMVYREVVVPLQKCCPPYLT